MKSYLYKQQYSCYREGVNARPRFIVEGQNPLLRPFWNYHDCIFGGITAHAPNYINKQWITFPFVLCLFPSPVIYLLTMQLALPIGNVTKRISVSVCELESADSCTHLESPAQLVLWRITKTVCYFRFISLF